MDRIIRHIENNSKRYLEELEAFLRLPSISTEKARVSDLKATAEFVAGQLRQAGMNRVEIFPTAGHPIVYGERMEDPDRPTVLVYGHYDVQPVDPLELWDTDPFQPTVREGKLFARGATDDKGQMMIHFKSAEAFLQVDGRLPVNLKFLIEGEEEIGGPNLDGFIEQHVDLLAADVVLISDTTMFAKGVPSICCGLRGLAYFEVEVIGPNQDLHSGSFGGPVPNPGFILAQIIASMKDGNGRVTIPGFYDDVVELTPAERRDWASLPFDQEEYQRELGLRALNGESGYTPLEQLWARPTLEVNGLLCGFTGEGAKTVLPSKAMAKISTRLVPHQDYRRIEEAFEAYVRAAAPSTVTVNIRRLHGGRPWLAATDHPALVTAGKAMERAFGKRPVFQREGGSIPIVATFTELLGAPCVLMGIGLPDENAHAPNENLDLDNFYRGIQMSAYFLAELARG